MYHGDPSHSGRSQSMPNVSGSPQVTESIKLDGAMGGGSLGLHRSSRY